MSVYKFIFNESVIFFKLNRILFLFSAVFIFSFLFYSNNGQESFTVNYTPKECITYKINENQLDQLQQIDDNQSELPKLILITPTYRRPTQMPDLTRMAQTLINVKNLLWILIEDSTEFNKKISDLVNRTKIDSIQLTIPSSVIKAREKINKNSRRKKKQGKGYYPRMLALNWIRNNFNNETDGVIYFADDDNAYDLRLFQQIRYTKKVSVFPVGLINKYGVSTPIVDMSTGKVIEFHDWNGGRKFKLDMAGFAVNLKFFLTRKKASMRNVISKLEDSFIQSLKVGFDDFEPLANLSTEVLVWHTKTLPSKFPNFTDLNIYNETVRNETNLLKLYENILS